MTIINAGATAMPAAADGWQYWALEAAASSINRAYPRAGAAEPARDYELTRTLISEAQEHLRLVLRSEAPADAHRAARTAMPALERALALLDPPPAADPSARRPLVVLQLDHALDPLEAALATAGWD